MYFMGKYHRTIQVTLAKKLVVAFCSLLLIIEANISAIAKPCAKRV
jgi:hypothetical protein